MHCSLLSQRRQRQPWVSFVCRVLCSVDNWHCHGLCKVLVECASVVCLDVTDVRAKRAGFSFCQASVSMKV